MHFLKKKLHESLHQIPLILTLLNNQQRLCGNIILRFGPAQTDFLISENTTTC